MSSTPIRGSANGPVQYTASRVNSASTSPGSFDTHASK
jgi:hypothetical protein